MTTMHNDLDTPTAERMDKAFTTVRAALALAGYTPGRSDGRDGEVACFAARCGVVHELRSLEQAQTFCVAHDG